MRYNRVCGEEMLLTRSLLAPALLIGLATGMFGGLLGLGGGVIMIPLMVAILGFTQHQAHGTSLVALVFTGLSGAISYAVSGSVDWRAALLIAATAVLTARLGARYSAGVSEWKLKRFFGIFLLFVGILLIAKPYLPYAASRPEGALEILLFLVTGLVSGFLSGLLGVGGGGIMVPIMVFLLGFSQVGAQGVSLLAMVPSGSVGAFTHWQLGNVRGQALWGLIPGIVAGSVLGSWVAHLVPDQELRIIFGVVQLLMAYHYLRTPRRNGD